jgi:hypothetical protein
MSEELGSLELRAALVKRRVSVARALLQEGRPGDEERTRRLVELFSFVAVGNPIARELVLELPRDEMSEAGWELARPHLDGSDSQPFREFAWLFSDLGLDDCLANLLAAAQPFLSDLDIREVVEDFGQS